MMIGIGSIFTILGAFVATIGDRRFHDHSRSERSSLLLSLAPNNSKLSLMRYSSIISLVAAMALVLPPMLVHYASSQDMFKTHDHDHISWMDQVHHIFTDDEPWYFMVIPFCILTFSQGLFIPPATVICLEPYPHIAGSITAMLEFWRIILPTLALMVITQSTAQYTEAIASVLIHTVVALCAFLCFLLMYGCISGHDVRLRMCGWQRAVVDNRNTMDTSYGTVESEKSKSRKREECFDDKDIGNRLEDVLITSGMDGVMVASNFSLLTDEADECDLLCKDSRHTTNANVSTNQKSSRLHSNLVHAYDPFVRSTPTIQF